MANIIPRDKAEEKYTDALHSPVMGQQAYSVRIAIGALIIKERLGLSDRETPLQIMENPYPQGNICSSTAEARCRSVSRVGSMARDIRARGLKTVCFSPEQFVYPINIAAKDDEYRGRSIDYLKKCVRLTAEFECPIMLITPGHGYYNETKEEAWKRAVDSLHTLSKEAESVGVALVMETFSKFGSNLVNRIADLQNIIAEVQSPALRPMLDTAPMYLAGEEVDEYFAAFEGKIEHVHLVDGDGQSAAHLAYGDGVYPLDSYIRSLRGYTGYITPELIIPKYLMEPEKSIKQCLDYLGDA